VDPPLALMALKQKLREVTCATKLAARLQPYVDSAITLEDFESEVRSQAAELSSTPFGELLSHTIGYIYTYKASAALGLNLGGALRDQGHAWGSNTNALRAMVRMYKISREVHGLEVEAQMKMMEQSMTTFLEGAWYVSVVDVESTLRHVCKKVLTDKSISRAARTRRAKALKRLGELLLESASVGGRDAQGKEKTLRERLIDAFPHAVAPAGQSAPRADDLDAELAEEADLDRSAASEAVSRELLNTLSVVELKAIMVAKSLPTSGLLEKKDLIDAIVANAEALSV